MTHAGPSAPPGDELERAAKPSPSAPSGDETGAATSSGDETGAPASSGETARQTFPRRLRLQRRREFLRVQRSGAKHHTRFFLVFVAPSMLRGRAPSSLSAAGLPSTRLGVTVTRKVGKAVKRNRIKRLVREAFRREHHGLPAGLDMVWVAKRDAVESTLEAVVHDIRALAGRLHAPRGRGGPRPGASSSPSAPARSR